MRHKIIASLLLHEVVIVTLSQRGGFSEPYNYGTGC